MAGLPTPLVLRNGLLGCVLPHSLRTEQRVIEIFDALALLLLHDHVASCFVYHDRERYKELFFKRDGLSGEIIVAKQHITNGLLNNLPSAIYFSNNMAKKYASTHGEYDPNTNRLVEWHIEVNRAILTRILNPRHQEECYSGQASPLLHELANWKIRDGWQGNLNPNNKEITPTKVKAKEHSKGEYGHFLEMKIFGGSIMLLWSAAGWIDVLVWKDDYKFHIVPPTWIQRFVTQANTLQLKDFKFKNFMAKFISPLCRTTTQDN